LNQIWCFRIVERGSDRFVVEVVGNRTAKTLVSIIKRWVALNTAYLVSDEWRGYSSLQKQKYNHKIVNHSKNFVNRNNPQIHTQTIENRWSQMKSLMKKRKKFSRNNFGEKIKETCWRMINRNNIQVKMFDVIVKILL